jgi:hypothetical protein
MAAGEHPEDLSPAGHVLDSGARRADDRRLRQDAHERTEGQAGQRVPAGAYFLAHIDKLDPKKRVKLASRIGAQGQTLFKHLVFREDPVTLFTAGGKTVTGW